MSGTKNSKELYKEVFSKLHASETVIREEEKMKNVKSRFRCSRLAAACISLALLMGATSGITYAATDGATANPVKAFRVYINGEEYDAQMQKSDDGYVIHLNQGDTAYAEIETDNEDSALALWQESPGAESDLTISEDGSSTGVAIYGEDGQDSSRDNGSGTEENTSGSDSSDRSGSSGVQDGENGSSAEKSSGTEK